MARKKRKKLTRQQLKDIGKHRPKLSKYQIKKRARNAVSEMPNETQNA